MPQLVGRDQIRRILETDRNWAAYALADLEPGYFEHSSWFAPAHSTPAVVLVYSAFALPVVLAVGTGADLLPIWDELKPLLQGERMIYFVIRPDCLARLQDEYEATNCRPMLRMVLDAKRFLPSGVDQVRRLGLAELEAVTALFKDGEATAEAPDFFLPEMLEKGIYYGVDERSALD